MTISRYNKFSKCNFKVFTYFLSFVFLAFFYGCTDLVPAEDSNQEVDRNEGHSTLQDQSRQYSVQYDEFKQQANRHFIHLAEQITGFGSIYLEEQGTRLVVRLTEQNNDNRADIENYVRSYLGEEAPIIGSAVEGGVGAMELRFEEAAYEYTQLYDWQDQIMTPVLDSEGVTFISLSQRNNKIRIGIEEDRFESQIVDLVRTNDLPQSAVKISVTGAVEDLRSNHTLRDLQRPLTGGLENNLYNSNGSQLRGACTTSFNALWSLDSIFTMHWLTNSHCTRERWSVFPNDEYFQSSIADGSAGYVGFEEYDPPGFTLPFICPSSRPCRYSDAALIKNHFVSTDFGTIARTEFSSGPGQGRGSLIIDQNNPQFEIVSNAEQSHFFEGLWLSKVGQRSGWTIGEITETCAHVNHSDQNIGDFRYLCQEFTTMHAEGGDSGSPVHASPYGWPDVRLYGILWGGVGQEAVFSRITGVMEDLGPMITH